MVYGIVQQHQGWIDCLSEVGKGTSFEIYLPRLPSGAVPAGMVPAASPVPHGSETVLLVDDEAVIRNVGRAILQRQGYQVLLAEDGLEAVEVYRRERGRIQLVILDLTMPRMSGLDTLRHLVQLDPAAAVLLSSGYSLEQVPEVGTEGVLGFVNKPYRPQDLIDAVHSALDKLKSEAWRRSASVAVN
jgi:DNA-binding NtrC family response regulator